MRIFLQTLVVAVLLLGTTAQGATLCGFSLGRIAVLAFAVSAGVGASQTWEHGREWRTEFYARQEARAQRLAEQNRLAAEKAAQQRAAADAAIAAEADQELRSRLAPYVDAAGVPYPSERGIAVPNGYVFGIPDDLVFFDTRSGKYLNAGANDGTVRLERLFLRNGAAYAVFREKLEGGSAKIWLRNAPMDGSLNKWWRRIGFNVTPLTSGGRLFVYDPAAKSVVEMLFDVPLTDESAVYSRSVGIREVASVRPLGPDSDSETEILFANGTKAKLSELLQKK